MIKCSKCNQLKETTDFSSNGRGGFRADCKMCYNFNWKYRLLSTLTSRSSKERKRPNGDLRKTISYSKSINLMFLENLKEKQNGLCYWLKIPIDFTLKDKLRKPSLDRLDNSKGYEPDNVVLTTVFANTGRRDASILEMESFIINYIKK